MEPISRRNALSGAALVGVGLPALAACSNSSSSDSGGSTGKSSGPTIDCSCHGSKFSAVDGSVVNGPATQPLAEATVAVKGADVEMDGEVMAATSDIPEGGGKIFPDQQVVVTQPDPGDFKAFSAICTHQKCLVTSVEPG